MYVCKANFPNVTLSNVCVCMCVGKATCVFVFKATFDKVCTARSVEDETRNGHRNAKRNPNRNQEPTILRLFSKFQTKRDLEQ